MHALIPLVWAGFSLLVVAAAVRLRRRLGERGGGPVVDDDAIRHIEAHGRFVSDEEEPLDLDAIEEEERRFWSEESWDPADEEF